MLARYKSLHTVGSQLYFGKESLAPRGPEYPFMARDEKADCSQQQHLNNSSSRLFKDATTCATEMEDIFAELGLSIYLHNFLEQGFDTWYTILDIKEWENCTEVSK
jgi:hypothetical protein